MAITIELRDREEGEVGTSGGYTLEYKAIATGGESVADVITAAESTVPTIYAGFPRQPLSAERLSERLFIVTARYSAVSSQPLTPVQEVDGWVYEYDTGETTVHATHSLETVDYAPASGWSTVPDYGKAINVSDQGIGGLDVPAPNPTLRRRRVFKKEDVSASWLRDMAKKAFRTNVAPWEGWSAGEVLYRTTSYTDRMDGNVEVSQSFSIGQNVTSQTVAGIAGLDKKAHEYVWVLTEVTQGTDRLVTTPRAAYVERIFETLDFNTLEP